ncbi:complex I NDUFA9 subunit family protein [Hellea balneolensis]|uniref:complex I NDUFA9 subunit family protein n=1 Tax=Hellea balneolensis TaxID=287478 RepID=UPI0004085652|nr:complex I NDUFA9 subunit family protein [Hellea balneolensis]
MTKGLITVFGGSGFLGKYVIRELVKEGWRVRVPVRRPHTAQELKVIGNVGQVQLVQANLRFKDSVERAVAGSDAVINLVALLFEEGKQSFENLHVKGAETLAKAAAAQGVTNFVQVSAIGADAESDSDYSRTKAEGERAVRDAVPTADIMRPSIIFGAEDQFFNRFAAMAQLAPALPLMGGGDTTFQPVYVGDVAQAIAKAVGHGTSGKTYELGGPRRYTFKELMQFMLETIDRKRFLVPVPWAAANFMGAIGEISGMAPFVKPFLTRDQVKNLKVDNVVSDDALGFADLDIRLETIEAIVPTYLARFRKYGQFHEKRV